MNIIFDYIASLIGYIAWKIAVWRKKLTQADLQKKLLEILDTKKGCEANSALFFAIEKELASATGDTIHYGHLTEKGFFTATMKKSCLTVSGNIAKLDRIENK